MASTRFSHFVAIGITVSGVVAVALFIAKDDLLAASAYRRFKSINPGDTYEAVVAKLGLGREVPLTDVPGKPSVHSVTHRDGPRRVVPLVEGNKVVVWEVHKYKFYIGFDQNNKVVEAQAVDDTSF